MSVVAVEGKVVCLCGVHYTVLPELMNRRFLCAMSLWTEERRKERNKTKGGRKLKKGKGERKRKETAARVASSSSTSLHFCLPLPRVCGRLPTWPSVLSNGENRQLVVTDKTG